MFWIGQRERCYLRESLILGFPAELAQRDRLVLALDGYFDDSGTHAQSDAVTVAGYISTAEQWLAFEREWKAALSEWELAYFHMSDFANRAQEYGSWTAQDCRSRFARLVGIINRHVLASIGVAIPKRAFDQIFPKRAKRFVGGAYGLAASCCFLDASIILGPGYPSARIAYVFEAGTRGSGEVKKVFDWNYRDREQRTNLKLISLKFEGKEFVPLQAADILAYELFKYLPYQIGIEAARPRIQDLSMLSACTLRSWKRLDDEGLYTWAAVSDAAAQHHGPSGKQNREVR